jgi:hypothetical protein
VASIPWTRFNITGASGSQGLLSPKQSWRCYVLPRGGHAAQDSSGTLITFDSASVASRFAANNWIQVGLSTANIRKVSAVGGNSLSVSGSAVTVTENDRVFLVGNTQPTVSGGSATYLTPQSVIRTRDDDGADIITNSMVTSNSDGLIEFGSDPSLYDCIIQDGNRSNQGSIVDLAVGAVEGISTSSASVFGATVTFLAGVSMNTTLIVGQSATFNGAIGVTGWATFGSTVTMNANVGVTGTLAVGGRASFGNSVSIDGALGITGSLMGTTATFTRQITGTSATFTNDVSVRRILVEQGTALVNGDFTVGASWGSGSLFSVAAGSTDMWGLFTVTSGTTVSANPNVTLNFKDGAFPFAPTALCNRVAVSTDNQPTVPFCVELVGTTQTRFRFIGTPAESTAYSCRYLVLGKKS